MRMFKTILVGMILAVAIIPLPGHTAATPASAPQAQTPPPPPADANASRAADSNAPAAAAPTPANATPAPTPAAAAIPSPAAPASLPAEVKPIELVKNGELKLRLNFQDVPVMTALNYLSDSLGFAVLSSVEQPPTSRITVISRQPVTADEALKLINSMLKDKGLTTVRTGDKTLRLVTLDQAKIQNLDVHIARDVNDIPDVESVETWVIPVSHVTAANLVQNLQSLLPEYATMTPNIDSNTLIITDTCANIRRLMKIIKALDTHLATVAEIRVWPLRNADATSTATLINTIFQSQAQGAGGRGNFGRGGFGGGNPLQMLMQMRGGQGPGGQGPGGRSGFGGNTQSGGNANIQVVAAGDAQTNRVVVRGPAEALDLVDKVIKALDESGAKIATVRVFQLRFADALNTADVINQLFGQQGTTNRGGGRGGRGGFGGGMQGGGAPTIFTPFGGPPGPGGNTPDGNLSMVTVTAAADSRTNTVVVTGPESVLMVVEDVVKKLDAPLSNVADVKVFRLEYADASNTAQLINEVFGQSRTSSSSRSRSSTQQMQRVQFGMGGRGGGGGMMFGGPQGGDTSSATDITVTASADTRTNSVVASGPAETLTVIAQIITELDKNPAAERCIFVYALKNATATSLMTILNNLFQEMATLNQRVSGTRSTVSGGARNVGGGGPGGGGGMGGGGGAGGAGASASSSNSNDLSEETYFEADPNTNSLLIMTSTKNYKKVKPIIDELDKPVGQVLIKVLFAELTHTNDLDVGTEFAMLNLNRNGGTQTVDVFGRPIDLTTPSTGAAALGAGVAAPTGLSIRTVQGDLDLTIHALQETGKLNVLSRPYVLTRNNRMATITVADEVPIPSTATNSGSVGTSTTFTYRTDIGIVLEVTPSINDDGLVNMIVAPKITTQTGQTVQIAEGLNPVVFSTRSAATRVAVKDGQTIVIGGLIQDKSSNNIQKVPLLGDIPLVGNLFKRTRIEKSKIELLIFLTPYVAKEPEELTKISDTEEARSSLNSDKDAAELYRRHMNSMRNADTEPNQPQP